MMFIHIGNRVFSVEPSWVVADSPTNGMELADIIAISAAMKPVRFTPIDEPFPYEDVALAECDGLLYSPARRALARRGIPEDHRLIMYPIMDTVPNFRTHELYHRDVMAAIGLKYEDEWVVAASIYGMIGSWRFSEDCQRYRSLLLDYQIGMLPAIPNSLGIVLNGMDDNHQALMNDLLAEIGYSPPVHATIIPDRASLPDIVLDGGRPLRTLPPQDRFAIVAILLGLAADYMAMPERRTLFILEYPEITGHLQTLVNLVISTPAIQWIVISRVEQQLPELRVVRW